MKLYFDAGAIVQFPAMVLPFTQGRQQGVETFTPVPLIGGHDLENVAVIGRGVLMSNNDDWMKLHGRSQATGHKASPEKRRPVNIDSFPGCPTTREVALFWLSE
jgi:hypothetical protein